jgi:hypothetical protein
MRIRVLTRRLSTSVALVLSTGALVAPQAASAQTADAPGVNSGVVVYNNGTANGPLTGTVANTTTGVGNGLFVTGPGTTATIGSATISTRGTSPSTGSLSSGIRATDGADVTITGGSIAATGARYTRGILSGDSTVNATDTDVSTAGANSHAVHAIDEGGNSVASTITLNGGTLTTVGADSFGIYAQNSSGAGAAGAVVNATGVDIVTSGTNGFGLFGYNGGVVNFSDGSIRTSGTKAMARLQVSTAR